MTLKPGGSWRATSGDYGFSLSSLVSLRSIFARLLIKLVFPLFPFFFLLLFFPLDHAFATVHHSSAREEEKTESVSQGRKRRRGRRKRRGKARRALRFQPTAHYPHTRALFFFLVHRSSSGSSTLRVSRPKRPIVHPDGVCRGSRVPTACLVATTCSSDRSLFVRVRVTRQTSTIIIPLELFSRFF